MSVVLLSRGTMSGVALLVERLREQTGVLCVSREDLVRRVDEHGELGRSVVEGLKKAPREYEPFCDLRRSYVILMRAALLEYTVQDDLIYHGYSGHLLLPPIRHFIRVRINAPMPMRIEMTRERMNCSREEAEEYLRQDDTERQRWARFMYGRDIRNPDLYDACLSLERMALDTVSGLVTELLRDADCQPTEESARAVGDARLASSVEAALVTDARTESVEATAKVEEGRVVITGPYLEEEQQQTVVQVALRVEGVDEVEYRHGYAPAFAFT